MSRPFVITSAEPATNGTLSTLTIGRGEVVPERWAGRCVAEPAKCRGLCEGECSPRDER